MKPSPSRMREGKFIDLLRKTKWSKWAHRFSVTLQGLLKIRCRHPALDFTRNRISGSKWPSEKPDELSFRAACPEQECRGAGRQWRPQKAVGILKHRPSQQARPQPFEGSQGGTPCPVIWCCASYPTGYYLAQSSGRSSSSAAAFFPRQAVETEIRKIIYGQIIYI